MLTPRSVVLLMVMSVWSDAAARTVREPELADCLESDSIQCARDTVLRAVFGQGARVARRVRAAEVPGNPEERETPVDEASGDPASNRPGGDAEGVAEGRGKKLKKLLPFLLMLKIQYLLYGVVAYVVVALIAKAALLKGSLALALSGVFLLRRLLAPHHVVARTEVKFHEKSHTKTYVGGGGGHSAADYGAGGYDAGYSGGHSGGAGGWDSYGAPVDQSKQYTHNPGHSVVYRSQKPRGR